MSHKSLNLILVWLQLTYTYQWLQPLLNAMLVWLNQSQLLAEHVITGCEKSEFTGGVKSSVPLLFFIMFVEPRLEQRKGPNCSYIKPIVLKKPHVKEVMRTPDGRYSIFSFCRPIIEYNTFVECGVFCSVSLILPASVRCLAKTLEMHPSSFPSWVAINGKSLQHPNIGVLKSPLGSNYSEQDLRKLHCCEQMCPLGKARKGKCLT